MGTQGEWKAGWMEITANLGWHSFLKPLKSEKKSIDPGRISFSFFELFLFAFRRSLGRMAGMGLEEVYIGGWTWGARKDYIPHDALLDRYAG